MINSPPESTIIPPFQEQLLQQLECITKAVSEVKDTVTSLRSTIDLQQKDINLLKKQLRALLKHQSVPFKEKPEMETICMSLIFI